MSSSDVRRERPRPDVLSGTRRRGSGNDRRTPGIDRGQSESPYTQPRLRLFLTLKRAQVASARVRVEAEARGFTGSERAESRWGEFESKPTVSQPKIPETERELLAL